MHRTLSGHRPRAPSPTSHTPRRGHHSLSIRTVNQQPQQVLSQQLPQHGTSGSPSQPLYPTYPLPIPVEKQAKARKLHHKYLMEVTLDRSKLEPQSATSYHNSFLSVPGPPGPQSVTSHTSSRHNRATSISTSTYDAVTELSSVVSFDGEDSPSAKARAKGELLSFDGTPVKSPRIRRRLSSVKRAKAALVRHLGSCWVCHGRKVPCPLEHHDLDSLLQLTPVANRTQSQDQFLPLPSNSLQDRDTKSVGGQETRPSFSQNDALAGIEGNAGLDDLGPIAATLDIQLPGSYGDTQLPTPTTINFITPELPPNPYHIYQNGDMFPLGLRNNFYFCQHLDGLCNDFFNTDEELQQHFALCHFEFTRITPAHRYVCSECQQWNNELSGPCHNCGARGSIQLWVFGHYIRTPVYQRHAPDGQSLGGSGGYPMPFSPVAFPSVAWDLGMTPFGGDGGAGGFNMQDSNLYGGPGNQAYDYNPPSGSDAGGGQFHGSIYGGAHQLAMDASYTIKLGFEKSRRFFANHRVTLLLLSLMVILTFGLNHQWILAKAEAHYRKGCSKLEAQLPAIGFLVILASFVLTLSVKYFAAKQLRRTQCVSIVVVLDDLRRKTNESAKDLDVLFMLTRILLSSSSAAHLHLAVISLSADSQNNKLAYLGNATTTPAMHHVL